MKHKNGFVTGKKVCFPILGFLNFIWEQDSSAIIMPSALMNYICIKF